MDMLKLMIVPSLLGTRLVARSPSGATCLRATLSTRPACVDALPRLLDGLSRFAPLHAALVVPAEEPSFATLLHPGWFTDVGGESYDLQVIGSSRRERRAWWGR